MAKTRFNEIIADWRRVKNHCRTTDNKDFTEKDPSDEFKKKLLMSEHTPIRLLEFDWTWSGIKYWVGMEWARHKFEKFISSQRNDRQENYDRNEARQDAPIRFDGSANMQNVIDAWRKRLCRKATPEARELAEDFKVELHKTHPHEADALVPNCIYRAGCPEFETCGFWKQYLHTIREKAGSSQGHLDDLQYRYDLYNEWFYDTHKDEN